MTHPAYGHLFSWPPPWQVNFTSVWLQPHAPRFPSRTFSASEALIFSMQCSDYTSSSQLTWNPITIIAGHTEKYFLSNLQPLSRLLFLHFLWKFAIMILENGEHCKHTFAGLIWQKHGFVQTQLPCCLLPIAKGWKSPQKVLIAQLSWLI